jgi:hypothetical protein
MDFAEATSIKEAMVDEAHLRYSYGGRSPPSLKLRRTKTPFACFRRTIHCVPGDLCARLPSLKLRWTRPSFAMDFAEATSIKEATVDEALLRYSYGGRSPPSLKLRRTRPVFEQSHSIIPSLGKLGKPARSEGKSISSRVGWGNGLWSMK